MNHPALQPTTGQYTLETSTAYDQQLRHATSLCALDSFPTEESDASHAHRFLFCSRNAMHIVEYDATQHDIHTLYQHDFTDERCIVSSHTNLLCMRHHYEIYDMPALAADSNKDAAPECKYSHSLAQHKQLTRAMHRPEEGKVLLLTKDECLVHEYDGAPEPVLLYKKAPRVHCIDWHPVAHHRHSVMLGVHKDCVHIDTRAPSHQPAVHIRDAHSLRLRDCHFNPQKPYCFATSGDDNRIRYWDSRSTAAPLKVLTAHSHFINRVRFNPLNDQLLLSASCDTSIALWNLPSLQLAYNAHHAHAPEDASDDEHSHNSDAPQDTTTTMQDSLACSITEHDDSVTDICWSKQSAWVFASVSYDGRCVVQHVPTQLQYDILDI